MSRCTTTLVMMVPSTHLHRGILHAGNADPDDPRRPQCDHGARVHHTTSRGTTTSDAMVHGSTIACPAQHTATHGGASCQRGRCEGHCRDHDLRLGRGGGGEWNHDCDRATAATMHGTPGYAARPRARGPVRVGLLVLWLLLVPLAG